MSKETGGRPRCHAIVMEELNNGAQNNKVLIIIKENWMILKYNNKIFKIIMIMI